MQKFSTLFQGIAKLFLKGLAVVIPVALTLAILWWMATSSERLLGGLLTRLLPEGWYVPGMGLLSALAIIVLVGLLSHILIVQRLFEVWENLVRRVPLAKTIYVAIKDFMGYFSPGQENRFSKVVLVQLPGQAFQLLGFVTRESFQDIPLEPAAEDPVAVYMPMSYQIGGYTLYLPRACLTPVDMPFEEAMRLAVTAGVSQRNDADA
ncbi:MAG: DUF502 domain-containing protein [Xanthomonadales bacterium]|nr:DUF502 domain-containing protein [Xanthomonadales bacterium]